MSHKTDVTGEILRMAPNFDNNPAYRANPGGRFSDAMLRSFKASFGLTKEEIVDLKSLIDACRKSNYLAPAAEIGEQFSFNQ